MANDETIFKILKLLTTAYPREPLQDEFPQFYRRMLSDIPDEILEAAVLQHISTSPYFPRVSELRQLAADFSLGSDRLPLAMEEWRRVCRLMIDCGHDHQPEFDNPITAQTIEAMGWRNLCLSTNQVSDRARFIETYNVYLQRAKREAVTIPAVRQLTARLRAPGIPTGQIPSWIEINQKVEEEM